MLLVLYLVRQGHDARGTVGLMEDLPALLPQSAFREILLPF